MKNTVYLEAYCSKEEFSSSGILRLPLESYITLYVYKFCAPTEVSLLFCTTTLKTENEEITLNLNKEEISLISSDELPWLVSMCYGPVVLFDDTIVTGLCGVARHICKYRAAEPTDLEYKDGLLGFRKACLQAPNEVSVWTKFCEVDLLKSTKQALSKAILDQIPLNLVKFENHLSKPVKVHNVYKIARDLKKQSLMKDVSTILTVECSVNEDKKVERVPKVRKWKSNIKKELAIDSSVDIESLDVTHHFAEGPFLTLADIILSSLYQIFFEIIGESIFKSKLPLTYKWFSNVMDLPEIKELKGKFYLNLKPVTIVSHKIPETENVSLYKCDPKRHNPKKRLFTKEADIESALNSLVVDEELASNDLDFGAIDWDMVPDGANPKAGHLPDERMDRKSQQLENLALAVLKIAVEGDVIVDFCCGSGHLGILLAHLLPKCTVILLENKEQSLLRARTRVHEMGLTNVYFFQCNLDFFVGKFDIGVALHACGVASDLVLDKCLKVNAKFVMCPCCYGSLHATDRLVYPRSMRYSNVSIDQYLCIGHAADQTHKDHPLTERGDRCMAVIDSDRKHLAQESGYSVTLSRLKPLSCTPKNNLLIGIPSSAIKVNA